MRYLSKNVATVPIKGEFLIIKSDVMPFSVYGAGSITLTICAFPFSAFASAMIWIDEVMSSCMFINFFFFKHTQLWTETALYYLGKKKKRFKGSPGIAVHSGSLSRMIRFSVICAGTVLLLNTASFTIWQQASRTYTAWDTLCTGLHTETAIYLICHTAALVYMSRIFNKSWIRLNLTQSVSGVWQLLWHSDPLTPGFAFEQLKKTIGSVHTDDNDSVLHTVHRFMLLKLCFVIEGRAEWFVRTFTWGGSCTF